MAITKLKALGVTANAITASQIANNTITNTQINSSAAIAQSKMAALASANMPAGSIIQVVQSTKLDRFQGQASTPTDITGTDQAGAGSIFCCKITPSSSNNKVLVIISCSINSTDAGAGVSLLRDGTEIFKGTASGSRARLTLGPVYGSGSYNNVYSAPVQSTLYLDSPSTTAEILIKPQYFSRGSANFNLGHTVYNTDNDNATRVPSSITLMEIKG